MPPKPRVLCIVDGAGQMMDGLGVAIIPRGDGHYSVSTDESGNSIETFAPNERVDVYAHFARNDRIKWLRGLRYIKHMESRQEIVFRKDAESGPWAGTALESRSDALLAAHRREWLTVKCEKCGGDGKQKSGSFKLTNLFSNPDQLGYVVKCEACHGTGDAGGLTWEFAYPLREVGEAGTGTTPTPVRVEFRRGFPAVVTVPRLADAVGAVIANGHGEMDTVRTHPAPWLAAVVRHWPTIEQVVCGDREPAESRHGWSWYGEAAHPTVDSARLPDALWRKLEKVDWPTRADAVIALARRIVAFAKGA